MTATDGVPLDRLEDAFVGGAGPRARATGSRRRSWSKAKNQLRARLVFENDSVTNIAHQLGFFETIASVDLLSSSWRTGSRR